MRQKTWYPTTARKTVKDRPMEVSATAVIPPLVFLVYKALELASNNIHDTTDLINKLTSFDPAVLMVKKMISSVRTMSSIPVQNRYLSL